MSVNVSRPLFCLTVKDDYPLCDALNKKHIEALRSMVRCEDDPNMWTFSDGTFSPDFTPVCGRGGAVHYYDMEFRDLVLAFVEEHKSVGSDVTSEE